MDMKRIGVLTLAVFTITIVIAMGVTVIVFVIDSFSLEEIGTEDVKCKDRHGREFLDEMCEDKIYCSWLGLIGDKKCGNSLGDEQ